MVKFARCSGAQKTKEFGLWPAWHVDDEVFLGAAECGLYVYL